MKNTSGASSPYRTHIVSCVPVERSSNQKMSVILFRNEGSVDSIIGKGTLASFPP